MQATPAEIFQDVVSRSEARGGGVGRYLVGQPFASDVRVGPQAHRYYLCIMDCCKGPRPWSCVVGLALGRERDAKHVLREIAFDMKLASVGAGTCVSPEWSFACSSEQVLLTQAELPILYDGLHSAMDLRPMLASNTLSCPAILREAASFGWGFAAVSGASARHILLGVLRRGRKDRPKKCMLKRRWQISLHASPHSTMHASQTVCIHPQLEWQNLHIPPAQLRTRSRRTCGS